MKSVLGKYQLVISVLALICMFGIPGATAGKPQDVGPDGKFVLTGTVTKVTDGYNRGPGNKVLATDGTHVYSMAGTWEDGPIKIVRSQDGGITWGPALVVAEPPFDWAFTGVATVAVSGEPAVPGRRIVHVVWEQADDPSWETVGIYYSWVDDAYLADAWGSHHWSTPIRINGSISALPTWARTCVNTTPSGDIHVIFQGAEDDKLYHTYAEHHSAGFTEPTALPGNPSGWEDIEAALDNAGNLHVAYPVTNLTNTQVGLEYTKKPAGSMTWTTPVTVAPMAPTGEGFTSIAAYDAENIYVANHNWLDVYVYRSTDGGATWQASTVFLGTADQTATRKISIAVDSSNVPYVGASIEHWPSATHDYYEDSQIFISHDGGRHWILWGVIPDQTCPSIQFDAERKASIVLWGANSLEGAIYFTKEK